MPRAAQSRPERSLRAVRGTAQGPLRVAQSAPRAAPSEEPLRIARSVPRAAQSRSELLEKPIGELGVTCTLHIRCSVLLHLVPSSPCMHMHGFALVYIYVYQDTCVYLREIFLARGADLHVLSGLSDLSSALAAQNRFGRSGPLKIDSFRTV